jgi:hypothetical protein
LGAYNLPVGADGGLQFDFYHVAGLEATAVDYAVDQCLIKVYDQRLLADTPLAEYDGCRRGTRGRGGWGARGNLVNCFEDAIVGPVGDFREAAASETEPVFDDWTFLAALRCLKASSL